MEAGSPNAAPAESEAASLLAQRRRVDCLEAARLAERHPWSLRDFAGSGNFRLEVRRSSSVAIAAGDVRATRQRGGGKGHNGFQKIKTCKKNSCKTYAQPSIASRSEAAAFVLA